jgi:cyclopropane fatty-acyl-phospholipid synthase-like methyltransferase
MMIYTSGFYQGTDQTLEEAQTNKLNMLCEKIMLKPGDSYLDIGCGWGTLVRHAARHFKVNATGVTLSAEGAGWCRANAEKEGLSSTQCEILNCDYREIPSSRRFNAISAVEMAEHVGIANFGLFLGNVSDMLEDDGLFYMQVAGLRKGSNWQDTQWGLFMSRWIFPGADASTPLYWYIKQLELAGFEVHSVENVGRHYSHTLHAWYDNWVANRNSSTLKEYPEKLKRLWDIFLAWSVVASGIGSASCYQIVSHKNCYTYPRDNFCSKAPVGGLKERK